MACLALLVLSTRAAAIPFFDVRMEVTAVAITADGTPGFDTQLSLNGDEPAFADAASLGAVDIATAGAIAALGLLNTSADVAGVDFASAVATAQFTGSFINAGAVNLSVDFSSDSFASGSGDAGSWLFVSLVSDGETLFEDYVQGLWQFSYTPVLGTTSVLGLTLSSEVSAAFLSPGAGNAGSYGMAVITGTVPEASSAAMLALGLGLVGFWRARVRRRAEAA